MSVGSNAVKTTAKTLLKDNFLKVMAACLIFVFSCVICYDLSGLISVVTGEIIGVIISFLMSSFLLLPLALGVIRYIWRMLFSVTDNPIAVFYWFSDKKVYIRAIKFILQFVFRIAFWFAILNIPSLMLFLLSKSFIFKLLDTAPPVWTANLEYYSTLLLNLTVIIVFAVMLKFYLAPILFVADDNMDVGEAMYTSSVISRKSSMDFIGLIASSIGWILISFLVLPLPITLPLLLTYYAVHGNFAVGEYNQHIENSKFTEAGFI